MVTVIVVQTKFLDLTGYSTGAASGFRIIGSRISGSNLKYFNQPQIFQRSPNTVLPNRMRMSEEKNSSNEKTVIAMYHELDHGEPKAATKES